MAASCATLFVYNWSVLVAAVVEAVQCSGAYTFSKPSVDAIRVLEGLGVEGDIHSGVTVKHRSRVQRDPTQPNLRQIHLIHAELHDLLREQGFEVGPGQMGENVTTRGIDLLGLATGTLLRFGEGAALVRVTGLRNPCGQLNGLREGLMNACVYKDESGNTVRLAGVMGIVVATGEIRPGDAIHVEAPDGRHAPLEPV